MSVVPISGRAGRVQVNGTNLNFDDCNVKFITTLGEITGFEDQAGDGTTVVNRTNALLDFQGTISGPIDTGSMPASTFKPGLVLTNLKIWLDKNSAPRYCGCSSVVVESVEYHPKVADAAQRVTISVKAGAGANGSTITITHPT